MNRRIAVLIIFLLPVILFLPDILSANSIFWGLPILQFYPWRELAFEQIVNGFLPLWNPYNGLGTPLLANYQSALLYPGTWIIFIFYLVGQSQGLVWGHLLVNLLHLGIAGFGISKIGEERGYSPQASLISALSFSLGGYFFARFGFFSMVWAAAWFPWIFFYSIRIVNSGKFSMNTVKLAGIVTLLLLCGHAQLGWYILVYCGIYFIFCMKKPFLDWLKGLIQFGIALLMALGIAAAQLIPTAELLLHSQRSSEVNALSAMTYSFWPWHFLNFLNPHIFGHPISGNYWGYGAYWEDAVYIGLLPMLLAFSTVFLTLRKQIKTWKKSELVFFGVISLIATLFALGDNSPIFPWIYANIPSFNMFNAPARYMIWFVFTLSILAGSAFDLWRKPEGKVLYWVRLGTAGGFAIGLGALLMLLGGDSIRPTFIVATFQISLLLIMIGVLYLFNPIVQIPGSERKENVIWRWVVTGFVIIDLLSMNFQHTPVNSVSDINTFLSNTKLESEAIYLVEDEDYEFRYNRTLNFDNYENTISAKQLADSSLANVNIFNQTTSLNNFEPMRLAWYDEFISALNKTDYENQKEILSNFGIDRIGRLDTISETSINYEKLPAMNRIQFFSNARKIDSVQSLLGNLPDSPCVYFLSEPSTHDMEKCSIIQANVSDLIWYGNIMSFSVDMPDRGWALLSNTYDTGWKLSLDGNMQPLYKANGFIMAFEIPSGKHNVEIKYLPDSIIFGSVISLVSFILMCILVYRMKKNQQ